MSRVKSLLGPSGLARLGALLVANAVVCKAASSLSNVTIDTTRPFVEGEIRLYGDSKLLALAPAALEGFVTTQALPVFNDFDLRPAYLDVSNVSSPETPGLENFYSMDVHFQLALVGSQSDLVSLLNPRASIVISKVLNGQLTNAGFPGTLITLWVGFFYTKNFSANNAPPNIQYATTDILVSAEGLWPFTTDKQTLLMLALQRSGSAVDTSYHNITSFERVLTPSAPRRMLLAAPDKVRVTLNYTFGPPTDQNLTEVWGRMLGPTFTNITTELGFTLNAQYLNTSSYVRYWSQEGRSSPRFCDPAPADCGVGSGSGTNTAATNGTITGGLPTESASGGGISTGALIGIIVGGVIGFVLLSLIALLAVMARRRKKQRAAEQSRAGAKALQLAKGADEHLSSNEGTSGEGTPGDGTDDSDGLVVAAESAHPSIITGSRSPSATSHSQQWRVADADNANNSSSFVSIPYSSQRDNGSPVASYGSPVASCRDGAVSVVSESFDPIPATELIPSSEISLCRGPDGRAVCLGEGGYGKVYRGLRHGVQPIAVKQLHDGGADVQRALRREIKALRLVSADSNVVQLYGVVLDKGPPAIVLELCEGGNLRQALVADDKGTYSWGCRGFDVACDILRGVCHIHASNVVHRDLKSSNVLLTKEGRAKIADVGLAKLLGDDDMSTITAAGTFAYAAPELLLGLTCSQKADIYSVGVLLLELVTGEKPVRGQAPNAQGKCPPALLPLLLRCLQVAPAERPSAPELYHELLRLRPDRGDCDSASTTSGAAAQAQPELSLTNIPYGSTESDSRRGDTGSITLGSPSLGSPTVGSPTPGSPMVSGGTSGTSIHNSSHTSDAQRSGTAGVQAASKPAGTPGHPYQQSQHPRTDLPAGTAGPTQVAVSQCTEQGSGGGGGGSGTSSGDRDGAGGFIHDVNGANGIAVSGSGDGGGGGVGGDNGRTPNPFLALSVSAAQGPTSAPSSVPLTASLSEIPFAATYAAYAGHAAGENSISQPEDGAVSVDRRTTSCTSAVGADGGVQPSNPLSSQQSALPTQPSVAARAGTLSLTAPWPRLQPLQVGGGHLAAIPSVAVPSAGGDATPEKPEDHPFFDASLMVPQSSEGPAIPPQGIIVFPTGSAGSSDGHHPIHVLHVQTPKAQRAQQPTVPSNPFLDAWNGCASNGFS